MTKIASPKTKPSITGRERNTATKPSRNRPGEQEKTAAEQHDRRRLGRVLARADRVRWRGTVEESEDRRGRNARDHEWRLVPKWRTSRAPRAGCRGRPGAAGPREPRRRSSPGPTTPRSVRPYDRVEAEVALRRSSGARRGPGGSGGARTASEPPTRADRRRPSARARAEDAAKADVAGRTVDFVAPAGCGAGSGGSSSGRIDATRP